MRYKVIGLIAAGACALVWLALGASSHAWTDCSTSCSQYVQGKCVEYTRSCREVGPSTTVPPRSYGAIAYSRASGSYGYSHKFANRTSAEKAALKYCAEKAGDCESITWFYNNCAAVAADGDIVAWGIDGDTNRASTRAVEECNKKGGKKCEVKVSHCSK